ncbi:RyR domain-containing protein [Acinetobacter modestus]|uniref:RyR domain-containing protein n=1 Tax=Acinetobacter modestus TaxID=1776740 RepID=UPI003017DCBB
MKTLAIAMACHLINTAYCQSLGDNSQPTWDDAPEQQRQSMITGVEMHLANPAATPEQSHESWYKLKEAEGWKYGEVKDLEKKEHQCFLPYDELPPEQKAKDYLFRATVHALKNLPDEDEFLALSAEVVSLRQKVEHQKNLAISAVQSVPVVAQAPKLIGTPIQYIGNKSLYKDHLYGSALTFEQGQVRTIPSDLATMFLKHPEFKLYIGDESPILPVSEDQLQTDDTSLILAKSNAAKKEESELEQRVFDEIETVGKMTKAGVIEYVQTKYSQKLNAQLNLTQLREKAVELINQFGLV